MECRCGVHGKRRVALGGGSGWRLMGPALVEGVPSPRRQPRGKRCHFILFWGEETESGGGVVGRIGRDLEVNECEFFRGGGERVEHLRERFLCATRRAALAFSPVTSAPALGDERTSPVLPDNLSVISEIRLYKVNRMRSS